MTTCELCDGTKYVKRWSDRSMTIIPCSRCSGGVPVVPKSQPSPAPLFDAHHDGETYEQELDKVRLNGQLGRVYNALRIRGGWMTLGEISADTGDAGASVSARIRDLRKPSSAGSR